MQSHRGNGGAWPAAAALVCLLAGGCAVSPEELGQDQLSALAGEKLLRVTADQEPVRGPIDLAEAIARALKHNLDHQVELAELAVRGRELDLAHYSLLPNVVAGSGYAARDKYNASSSMNIFTQQQSLATSTSQDKALRTADIAFGWNILDFGLSYVRARQSADKVLIQNELRRKVTLRLIEDTRAAYWRAVSAQRLLERLTSVERLAREVEREAGMLAGDRQTSIITARTYEREVLEIQRKIGEIARELKTAKAQLAALMNVAPGKPYRVVDRRGPIPKLPQSSMKDLLHMAVMSRPELKEVEYRKRINEQEAHAALIEMLPGVNVLAGNNFDSNSFLYSHNWVNWGARASWNLLKVFSYPARREVIDEQDRMLDMRSLAVTMAIMTQVYVSRVRYGHSVTELRTAQRYRNVQNDLLVQIRSEAAAGRVSRQTLVREELNAVVAEARLDLQYAMLQAAYANMQASLGMEPFDTTIAIDQSISGLAKALRAGTGPKTMASASLVR